MFGLLLVAAALCPQGDLAQHHHVTGTNVRGDPGVVTQALVVGEGTPWDDPQAVRIDNGGNVIVDLDESWPLAALVIQADNDDEYAVDGSVDGTNWRKLWVAEADFTGPGLRTRHTAFRHVIDARFLRVRPRGGDGNYSVARLRALCYVPRAWEGEWLQKLSPARWWRQLNNDTMVQFKGWVALFGALLLLAGALLEWLRRAHILKRTRDGLLILLAVVSCASWFNLFHYHFEGFVHDWEFFHYYLGAKYFPEIGYTHLYECATAAELQTVGLEPLQGRQIRNLTTNHLESAQPILDNPRLCTDRFTPQRWNQFVADVMYFRGRYSTSKWNDVIHDHGYNATPVWGLAGRFFASGGPATWDQISHLALLDPALLFIMWCFSLWAFGWRPTAVAMCWWGTNLPARWLWNGGAYLRMDWLACAVIGLCLFRKQKPGASGFMLTTSALLRVFPGFIVMGMIVKAGWELLQTKKLAQSTKRFVVGCVVSIAILVPLSIAVCGAASYPAFVVNSKKHLSTALTNNMGWKTWVAYQDSTRVNMTHDGRLSDPFMVWKDTRNKVFEQRKGIFYAGILAFLALLTWSVRKKPEWVALALGVGFIPVATEITCYYYSVFLIFGFLWLRNRAVGVALLLLSAFTCMMSQIRPMEDESFFFISIATVAFSIFACVAVQLFDQGQQRDPLEAAATSPAVAAPPAGKKRGKAS